MKPVQSDTSRDADVLGLNEDDFVLVGDGSPAPGSLVERQPEDLDTDPLFIKEMMLR